MSTDGHTAKLAALNLWSTSPESSAEIIGGALQIALTSRGAEDGQHFSGRAGDLMVSVHPGRETSVELAFTTDDMDAALAACTTRGASVVEGPERKPYGVSAHLVGPDGLRFELVAMNTVNTD